MKLLELQQGSDEWLAMRHAHHNASEAAAMLGLDPKTSRTMLLKMRSFGHEKLLSDYVKKMILEKGHDVEARARAIIEAELCEDLYPVSGCDDLGWLYASLDGQTMDESIIFEHKQWNEDLAASVRSGTLPDTHMPQVQHQLMVSGASVCKFVVSDGTAEKREILDVLPDSAWFERIANGWKQFEKDLLEYRPEPGSEVIILEVIELPALSIQTTGEIAIKSNLSLFGEELQKFVKRINMKPDDDQGFADAEFAIKILEKAEKSLTSAEDSAIAQMATVEELKRAVSTYRETARQTRLALQKVVKDRKEFLKSSAIHHSRDEFSEHVRRLETETTPIRLIVPMPDFVSATKNLRTLESFREKVADTLASGKIEADRIARETREKLRWYNDNASGYVFLFSDLQLVIQKPMDDFRLVVQSRIDERKKQDEERLEKEREKIRQEESAKLTLAPSPEKIGLFTDAEQSHTPSAPIPATVTPIGNKSISSTIETKLELIRLIADGLAPLDLVDLNQKQIAEWSKTSGKSVKIPA